MTDITELAQMKGQKVEGSYYLAECTDCGKMYPSNKLNGGEPLFSGDYGECYCPHCGADDAAIGDCGDTAATAWNYQQGRIDALVEALEKAQTAPVVPETAHSSVIAEQLANVLSDMKVTDHQRAVISCAVDRLNNVAQLLQLSPSALLVPEILDYQGAKELYNYLMTEEETNATVNGWNACRAAMLNGGSS